MQKHSVVFFGTHEFAVRILEGLLQSPTIEVVSVVTQPDKPVGRKQELQPSPVKILAAKRGVSVIQPESLKQFSFDTTPDLFVVAQYGKLIPEHLLKAPAHGTINVHTSLLPNYRGASPIQSSIWNGDSETGVTIMLMDVGMDTGPILAQQKIEIDIDDTYALLEEKMAYIASPLLLETIEKYIEGKITPQVQDDTEATSCRKLSREDGQIDWNKTTAEIYNQYRAFTPWPGVWSVVNGKRLKLLQVTPSNVQIKSGVLTFIDDTILIGTQDASIEVKELQIEGKSKMSAREFMNGYASLKNSVLESMGNSSTNV